LSVALSHAAFVSDAKFVDGRFVAANQKPPSFSDNQPVKSGDRADPRDLTVR